MNCYELMKGVVNILETNSINASQYVQVRQAETLKAKATRELWYFEVNH